MSSSLTVSFGTTRLDYCVFFSAYTYFTLIIVALVVHILYMKDHTINKYTLTPYLYITLYGITSVMFYVLVLTFDLKSNPLFWNTFIGVASYFWFAIALSQFLIWDLISALVKFQAKYRLEECDVRRFEHKVEEQRIIRLFKILHIINFVYHVFSVLLPIILLKVLKDEAFFTAVLYIDYADLTFLSLSIIATVGSFTRIMF